jgi:hypothetical protein
VLHRRGATLWALSMVHSRSFLLAADDDGVVAAGTRAMVPMADQFNHAPPPARDEAEERGKARGAARSTKRSEPGGTRTPWAVVRTAHGGAAFSIVAPVELRRGDEATISYGASS